MFESEVSSTHDASRNEAYHVVGWERDSFFLRVAGGPFCYEDLASFSFFGKTLLADHTGRGQRGTPARALIFAHRR